MTGTERIRQLREARAIEVKVLESFDGLAGRLVETVRRVPVYSRPRDWNGLKRITKVSYRGKLERVFNLPQSYGDLAGLCISIK
jgi:hypothetical protein